MDAGERYKGHDELIEAWRHVIKEVPSARLMFIGDGDDAWRLKAKVADVGLASSVKLPGFLNDAELSKAYREASVFAMPSRNEGFGLVYIEAMSHGVPCIGSLDDAARDVIVDGETGYLVAQSDVSALADRLIRLLSDPMLRQTMGANARTRVRNEYTYSRFRDQFTALLSEHLEPRPTMVGAGAHSRL
jgi:phosphatidylinositol alpha-1,6-mannosyltransferase